MILAIVGLCAVEVKPLGPVQLQPVAPVALPVKVNVLPTQIGLGAAEADTAVGTVQPMQPKATQVKLAWLHASKQSVVVLKMSKLFSEAPGVMALRCAVVSRGMSKPLL